jgi:SAM-dependent methyltransferase
MADVNCDVEVWVRPDVAASVLNLPFRENCFSSVLFTDVIEHLPPGTEEKALREIHRCLAKGGRLILTTPNDVALFTICDAKHWVEGHRHYKPEIIHRLLTETGFSIRNEFASGWLWQMVEMLVYFFVGFPIRKITGILPPVIPFLEALLNKEYSLTRRDGYTLFFVAHRE